MTHPLLSSAACEAAACSAHKSQWHKTQPALGFLSIDSLKFPKWVCKTEASVKVWPKPLRFGHGLSLVYTVQEEISSAQRGMMDMKLTSFPKLTSERGRQKHLWISPLWISVRSSGSHLAGSPSLVKKPLGLTPPFVHQWHSFTENWSEVEHSASTLKYCYFWEEETARGRHRRREHGGHTRLTVLETECLHRNLNIHSKEADCHGNSVAQLCPAAGKHGKDSHQEYSLLL